MEKELGGGALAKSFPKNGHNVLKKQQNIPPKRVLFTDNFPAKQEWLCKMTENTFSF
mgnify:CR=1 FL=1